MKMRLRVGTMGVTLLGLACASTPPGAQPEDMSADDHRTHAAGERTRAEQADATEIRIFESATDPRAGDWHRRHARQHEEAAALLTRWRDAACVDVDVAARKSCPLMAEPELTGVEERPDGIWLHFEGAGPAAMEQLLQSTRCHVAEAAHVGREGMDACPFYIRGLSVDVRGDALVVRSTEPDGSKAFLRRAHLHLCGVERHEDDAQDCPLGHGH